MRTYEVNQVFRYVEGIWLNGKSRRILFFLEKAYFTSYVRNMLRATILCKYHEKSNQCTAKGIQLRNTNIYTVQTQFSELMKIIY